MRVDFHTHSTASDGTLVPAALAEAAHAAKITAIALTDHDTCRGVLPFQAAARGCGLAAATGLELSIEPGKGFDQFHLLALGVDPAHPQLAALLERIRRGRDDRNARIVANFARLGFVLSDIADYAVDGVLARPHFAAWLVRNGHAATISEAFAQYLTPDSPAETRCYEERWQPTQEEAFSTVHAAGGLAIMAHPKYASRSWRETGCDFKAAATELAALREKGLDGIEACYGANTPEETVAFLRIASANGYLVSAGSDFHGANKPSVTLGMDVDESLVRPLLERLNLI